MKRLIIPRGWPGSGKSTLCRSRLAEYVDINPALTYDICSADSYFYIRGSLYAFDQFKLHSAHQHCMWKVEKNMEFGTSLIFVDNTNTTWKEIRPYVQLANKYGYQIEFVEPNTPWRLSASECATKNTHSVPKAVIQKMMDRFQPTSEIEELIASMPVDPTQEETLEIGPEHTLASLKFVECVKKRIVVKAAKIDTPFSVHTLEGVMRGKAGDYLMVGVKGERYPCDASIFEETYEVL